jgi:hypothetical protein
VLNEFNAAPDKNIFRSPANKLKLQLSGDTTSHKMMENLKKAVTTAFTTHFKVCDKVGRDWSGKVHSGELKPEWFSFEEQQKLTITLPRLHPNDPGSLAKKDQGIYIEFTFDQCFGINGAAAQNDQILVIPSADNDSIPEAAAGGRSGTVCHELGHRMGMTIFSNRSKIPKGMPAAKHVDEAGGLYYLNGSAPYINGIRSVHVGPHCAHGIADPDKVDSALSGKTGSCIMYGSGDPAVDARKNFCPTCTDFIKARKLTSIICDWNSLSEENS